MGTKPDTDLRDADGLPGAGEHARDSDGFGEEVEVIRLETVGCPRAGDERLSELQKGLCVVVAQIETDQRTSDVRNDTERGGRRGGEITGISAATCGISGSTTVVQRRAD